MSFLTKIKGVPSHLPSGLSPAHGVKGFLYDKGIRGLMSVGLGAAKGYYYDKLVFKGIGIEALVAIGGYLGAAMVGGSMGRNLERAGDVGLTAYLYTVGASWGSDKADRGVATTKKLPSGKKEVVGVIPPRGKGAFLTAEEMASSAPR